MQPLYFNPLDSSGNFIGTNPLKPTGIPVRTTVVSLSGAVPYGMSCFNPSLYQPYTFFTYPFPPFSYTPTTYFKSTLIGSNVNIKTTYGSSGRILVYKDIQGNELYENYYTQIIFSTQFSTFYSTYAASYQIDPVIFSIRFGTEKQPLYANTSLATNVINTYENIYTEQFYWYNLQTWEGGGIVPGPITDIASTLMASGLYSSFIANSVLLPQASGSTFLGSSSFVNMLGSNVYSALLDSTNSVIIYQNEQISSYYSQSLSYQVNVINLTAALNSVAGPDNDGTGTITVTYFSWVWESTNNGWTGSQFTDFPTYTYKQTVNYYLYFTYGGTIIGTNTQENLPVTIVQSLLSIQNNNLANAQTFLNNAVTTLQSQVSLAGQIITALASGMETLINNI